MKEKERLIIEIAMKLFAGTRVVKCDISAGNVQLVVILRELFTYI